MDAPGVTENFLCKECTELCFQIHRHVHEFKGKAPNKITNNKIQFVLIVIKKFLWLFNYEYFPKFVCCKNKR